MKADAMQGIQDFADIVGRTDEKFGAFTDANGAFGMRLLGLCAHQQIGRVLLGLQEGRNLIAIVHVLRIVQQDHARFKRLCGSVQSIRTLWLQGRYSAKLEQTVGLGVILVVLVCI